jgi:hypothetical protein
MRRRASFSAWLSAALIGLVGLTGSGCNLDNPGDAPPAGLIYLPSGLLLAAQSEEQAARYLYVVNSNFDLRYNAGSLQAYDLERLDTAIARCEARDNLGPDCEIDPEDILGDEVLVPSFATALTASDNHDRLFVVSRTEASLRVIDLNENASRDVLDCGDDNGRRCNDDFIRGDDPDQSRRRLVLPEEPVAMIAGRAEQFVRPDDAALSGAYVVVAHRGGQASLFLESDGQLNLTDVLTDLPQEPTGLVFDPLTRLMYLSVRDRVNEGLGARLVARGLVRVGVAVTGSDYPAHLYMLNPISLEGLIDSTDTRGVALNPLRAGETLVLGRSPATLLWADVAGSRDEPVLPNQAFINASVDLGAGPSRIIVGELGERTVAVVSCFDARQVYIVDVQTAEPLSIIHNFSGPFELALDENRQRLYVADFRASVVRVLDLSRIVAGADATTPTARIIATLGHPKLVQELQ